MALPGPKLHLEHRDVIEMGWTQLFCKRERLRQIHRSFFCLIPTRQSPSVPTASARSGLSSVVVTLLWHPSVIPSGNVTAPVSWGSAASPALLAPSPGPRGAKTPHLCFSNPSQSTLELLLLPCLSRTLSPLQLAHTPWCLLAEFQICTFSWSSLDIWKELPAELTIPPSHSFPTKPAGAEGAEFRCPALPCLCFIFHGLHTVHVGRLSSGWGSCGASSEKGAALKLSVTAGLRCHQGFSAPCVLEKNSFPGYWEGNGVFYTVHWKASSATVNCPRNGSGDGVLDFPGAVCPYTHPNFLLLCQEHAIHAYLCWCLQGCFSSEEGEQLFGVLESRGWRTVWGSGAGI